MIFIGLGSNLDSQAGSPRATCEAALKLLPYRGVEVLRCSPWYESAPVPPSDQPWYVNAVAEVNWDGDAGSLLTTLLEVEVAYSRVRSAPNAARTLDLDLISFHDQVVSAPDLTLPHPQMRQRAFVLLPLKDLTPDWRHPGDGRTVADLIAAMPEGQVVRPLASVNT